MLSVGSARVRSGRLGGGPLSRHRPPPLVCSLARPLARLDNANAASVELSARQRARRGASVQASAPQLRAAARLPPPAALPPRTAASDAARLPPPPRTQKHPSYSGTFSLLALNYALFLADHVFHYSPVASLYLHHVGWEWWQFITCTFCHASWEHLSGNAFLLLIFGKAVEQEEGPLGVWLAYLFCGLGASVASLLFTPAVGKGLFGAAQHAVSLGASGAVFGLFAVSVLVKLSLDWRKLLESFILGSFVVKQLMGEVSVSAAGGVPGVSHAAHIGGALCGLLLIALLSKLGGGGAADRRAGEQ